MAFRISRHITPRVNSLLVALVMEMKAVLFSDAPCGWLRLGGAVWVGGLFDGTVDMTLHVVGL